MAFKLTELVADPSVAPKEWQQSAPREFYARAPVSKSEDLDRVLALPRRALELDGTDRAEAIIDLETEKYAKVNPSCRCAEISPERHAAEGCITRLRLLQALALREISIVGGLLGPLGVGSGKTLIDLLAPAAFVQHAKAHEMPGAEDILCVLLVPPGLVTQLADDYAYIGEHFHMPSMIVQGNTHLDRLTPGAPRLQVMPYSRLSRSDATTWLTIASPHAIIADEAHKIRNAGTATTARVLRFFSEHPGTRFAGWSGSLTSKSIKNFAHLSALALKAGSPLPVKSDVVDDWARAIDPGDSPADPGPLLRGLIETKCCLPGESLHTGIHRRLSETLGVVSSSAPSIDCDLEILQRKDLEVPAHVQELIDQALEFVRPDGEELVTAMQAAACACEIACGFHYRWIFPKHMFPRDDQLVEDWREARKEWHKELRQFLKQRAEHLDSPMLAEHAAQRAHGLRPIHKGLPVWEAKTYRAWAELKPKVQYEGDAVRIDDFLVQDVAKFALKDPSVIWYQHGAFGEWLAEVSGLPIFGGGKDAKAALLGNPKAGMRGEDGSRSVICSIKAHGTGTNGLQYNFSRMLFPNVQSDPSGWEQALGRLHRPGQKAESVQALYWVHTKELRRHVAGALRSALYVQGVMGVPQRLRMGIPEVAEIETEE